MTRALTAVLIVIVVVLLAWGSSTAAGAAPLVRPNPVLVGVRLDYVNPILAPSGGAAGFEPLPRPVIWPALRDEAYLEFRSVDDLGGFLPAPLRQLASTGLGVTLVGQFGDAEIPELSHVGDRAITSFAPLGPGTAQRPDDGQQPDNGVRPVPGVGRPGPFLPPTNDNALPPPNRGFGGKPKPPVKRPKPTPAPPTTTTTPAPPTTTTVPGATTTDGPTAGGGTMPAPSCGTTGLAIASDLASCRIFAVNMSPGGSATQLMTIRNDSGVPFALSLRAEGNQNRLWNDLRMGVWQVGTAAPQPLPPLLWWTTQASTLTTLQPGDSIRYEIELYLPASAGNEDQALAASIDLVWRAES